MNPKTYQVSEDDLREALQAIDAGADSYMLESYENEEYSDTCKAKAKEWRELRRRLANILNVLE